MNNALKVGCKKFKLRKTSFVHVIFDILFWLCTSSFTTQFSACVNVYVRMISLFFLVFLLCQKFSPGKDHVMWYLSLSIKQVEFSGSFTLCTGCEWQTVNGDGTSAKKSKDQNDFEAWFRFKVFIIIIDRCRCANSIWKTNAIITKSSFTSRRWFWAWANVFIFSFTVKFYILLNANERAMCIKCFKTMHLNGFSITLFLSKSTERERESENQKAKDPIFSFSIQWLAEWYVALVTSCYYVYSTDGIYWLYVCLHLLDAFTPKNEMKITFTEWFCYYEWGYSHFLYHHLCV